MTRVVYTAVAAIASALACLGTSAGPIDPPAGPVAPTMKTLDEIEARTPLSQDTTPGDSDSLFKITQPGSYFLTRDTAVLGNEDPSGGPITPVHGIEISASQVTIDLNGYTLRGSDDALAGICTTTRGLPENLPTGLVVRNGNIVGFPLQGISIAATPTLARGEARLENLNVRECGDAGILAPNATVENVHASDNLLTGIAARFIDRCIADRNSIGIDLSQGGHATHSTANHNTLHGFLVQPDTFVDHCVASSNTQDGFRASGGRVSNCRATANTAGFRLINNDVRLEHNNASDNGVGYTAFVNGNTFIGNTAYQNTQNWQVTGGNLLIVVEIGLTDGVSGDSGGTASATNPFTNFSFTQ